MTICRYEERWNTVQYWWNLIDLLGNVGTCWEMLGNSKLHSQHLKMLLFDANSIFYPVGWVAATMAFCRPRTPAPQKSRSPKRSESALPVITYHITGWQSPCLGLTYRRINNKSWRRKTMKDLWILWKSESLDIPAGLLDDSSRHSEHPRFCTHTVLRWTKSALIHTATCHNLSTFWHRLVDLFNFLSSVDCKDQVSTFQAWVIDLQLETAERRKQSMVLCIAGILDQGSSWIWPRSNKQPEREAWKSVCRSSKWPSSPPDPWHWASVHMCPFL